MYSSIHISHISLYISLISLFIYIYLSISIHYSGICKPTGCECISPSSGEYCNNNNPSYTCSKASYLSMMLVVRVSVMLSMITSAVLSIMYVWYSIIWLYSLVYNEEDGCMNICDDDVNDYKTDTIFLQLKISTAVTRE